MKATGIALILAAACTTASWGFAEEGTEAKYTSTAWLRIRAEEPAISGRPARQFDEKEFDIYKKTQQQLVKSRFVLLSALRKPEVAKLPSVQMEQQNGDPVRWLENIVKVEFPDNAEMMSVSVSRDDPNEAATLARAVVDAYLVEVVNTERDLKRQRLSELDRAFSEKEMAVRSKREDLKKLAGQLGVSDSETLTLKQKLTLDELSIHRHEVRELQAKLRSFQIDLAVQKALLDDAKDEGRVRIAQDIKRLEASIAVTTEQESVLKTEVDRYRQEAERFGSSSIDIEMMRADIKNLEAVLAEISKERERLKIELRATPRVTLLQRADVPESKD